MPHSEYDVIVIGVGSMGSAACFFLAERGHSVLGLEQFVLTPHHNGSHGGQSRIIRKAYFEHPDYVPLLQRAYDNWHQLEQLSEEQVYFRTGLLYAGPADHPIIRGVQTAAAQYHLGLGKAGSFPFFNLDEKNEMLFEPNAGFLTPGKAITLYVREALKKGAGIRTGQKVISWERTKTGIKVLTQDNTYTAKKLIITAGAWAEPMIKDLKVPLKVTRQLLVWVEPPNPQSFEPDHFPCWVMAIPGVSGAYYGFPYLDGNIFPGPTGLKFALHYPDLVTSPDQVNREVSMEEIRSVVEGIKDYFPASASKLVAAETCLYTNSPDEAFIIDHLPGYDADVTIACGFSGHGFKFVSVVGEILADLSMKGKTQLPVGFLSLKRFQ